MDKKNLAKAAFLAMALTAGAVSADAATNSTGFETSTLLAVAGCAPHSPQGGGYGNNYSQDEYSRPDDAHSPYSMQSRGTNNSSYGYETERQGGGFDNNRNNKRSMSGGGAQSNPYSNDQKYQTSGTYSSSPYNSSPPNGGGSYQTQRNSNPALNTNNDPYSMQTSR